MHIREELRIVMKGSNQIWHYNIIEIDYNFGHSKDYLVKLKI